MEEKLIDLWLGLIEVNALVLLLLINALILGELETKAACDTQGKLKLFVMLIALKGFLEQVRLLFL